jgi:hypothetical protein
MHSSAAEDEERIPPLQNFTEGGNRDQPAGMSLFLRVTTVHEIGIPLLDQEEPEG